MCDIEKLRLFVNERLSAVAEDILAVFVTTIVQYQQHIDETHRHGVTSDLATLSQVISGGKNILPVCEEESSSPEQQEERRPDLLQEEPQPPQIKEEREELFPRPEEDEGSTMTLLAVKSEYIENRQTEPLASNSTKHVKTQADVESRGASQPSNDVHLVSSRCSESDTEDSDDWRQTPSMRAHAMERTFSCTVCGKTFNRNGNLKRHTRTHMKRGPFRCTLCGKRFSRSSHLKIHTGSKMCNNIASKSV